MIGGTAGTRAAGARGDAPPSAAPGISKLRSKASASSKLNPSPPKSSKGMPPIGNGVPIGNASAFAAFFPFFTFAALAGGDANISERLFVFPGFLTPGSFAALTPLLTTFFFGPDAFATMRDIGTSSSSSSAALTAAPVAVSSARDFAFGFFFLTASALTAAPAAHTCCPRCAPAGAIPTDARPAAASLARCCRPAGIPPGPRAVLPFPRHLSRCDANLLAAICCKQIGHVVASALAPPVLPYMSLVPLPTLPLGVSTLISVGAMDPNADICALVGVCAAAASAAPCTLSRTESRVSSPSDSERWVSTATSLIKPSSSCPYVVIVTPTMLFGFSAPCLSHKSVCSCAVSLAYSAWSAGSVGTGAWTGTPGVRGDCSGWTGFDNCGCCANGSSMLPSGCIGSIATALSIGAKEQSLTTPAGTTQTSPEIHQLSGSALRGLVTSMRRCRTRGRAIGVTFPLETIRRRAPPAPPPLAQVVKIRSDGLSVFAFRVSFLSEPVLRLWDFYRPGGVYICIATAMTPGLYHMNHNAQPRGYIKPSPWPPSGSSAAPRAWCRCRQSPTTCPRASRRAASPPSWKVPRSPWTRCPRACS